MSMTIVVVGVPWSLDEIGLAARDAATLGTRIVLVDTPEALASVDGCAAVERRAVPALEPGEICAAIRDIRPVCVLAITELAMKVAAEVRERLGLPGTSALAEQRVIDKLLTRQVLRDQGLTAVPFRAGSLHSPEALLDGLSLPVVVKPRALTGSHGVRFVSDPAELCEIARPFDLVTAARFGRDELVAETFIPGPEISAEALVVEGELILLAMTDKVNTGPPYFHEIGHVMPSRYTEERVEQVSAYLQDVAAALGLVTSPVHAELKLLDGGVELVEIHSRFGGGRIVRLLEETYALRPYEAYFAAMLEGRRPEPRRARGFFGSAFFTGDPDRPFAWRSFDFPHPDAVLEVDLDVRRQPKLREYEGVRLRYWRAGHVLFGSDDYDKVHENVLFMRDQVV